MYNSGYNFFEKHLGKTKFWKLYTGNRVFRYIFKVLVIVFGFSMFYIHAYYIGFGNRILNALFGLFNFFVYILLLSLVVNIRSDTTLMVALKFFLGAVIIFGTAGLCYWLGVNNILPRPPQPLF